MSPVVSHESAEVRRMNDVEVWHVQENQSEERLTRAARTPAESSGTEDRGQESGGV